jgi:hypothetical protein
VKPNPSGPGMQLKVDVAGDRRLAEQLILEVRALAQRFGLEPTQVRVVSRPAVGPKTLKIPRSASRPSPRS